jgi:hypothetical protein
MPKYFFHLMGDVSAHDLLGHDCTNDKVAEEYGKMLARDVGTDKPQMIRDGNYIAVANEDGNEIAKIPLRSMSA